MKKYLKQFFSNTIFNILFVLWSLPRAIWWLFGKKEHWSGIIPAILLILFGFLGYKETKKQLKILQEQISYQRTPVVYIHSDPDDNPYKLRHLYLANAGKDTIVDVSIRTFLFLVTNDEIYSYGHPYNVFRTDPDQGLRPKDRISNEVLAPNEKYDFTKELKFWLWKTYPSAAEQENELIEETEVVKELFEGEYVFFIEYSYRRVTDLLKYTDTTYLYYPTLKFVGVYEDLKLEIGGSKVINRLEAYMSEGPLLSINIEPDKYVIYKFPSGFLGMRVVKEIPRRLKKR